ncbi:MAG: PHB depolymerase family esterase [Gemmatimonadaceae bacterium]
MRVRPPHLTAWLARIAATIVAAASLTSCIMGGHEPVSTIADAPGTGEFEVQVGDLTRSFFLHIPANRPRRLGRAVPYPLVIVLHGSGANGETVRRMSGMDGMADTARFVVAYPNGTTALLGRHSDWNSGECCGAAQTNNVDDIAFIRALVDNLSKRMPVDPNRIYVAGFSDGARLAYRAACELSTKIAAVAIVSGSLMYAQCAPQRAIPLIAFHGTADEDVLYSDSSYATPERAPLAAAASAPPSIRFWSAHNGCSTVTVNRRSLHVTQMRFGGCAGEVTLFTIDEGLHAWPGGVSDGQEPTHEISATREAWRFFARHPLR